MKQYCSDLKENLPVIVLLSHGPLAEALLESARLIAGDIENAAYLCLEEGDNPQDFKKEIEKLLNSFTQRKLVMVDLLGGTPCNSFVSVVNSLKSEVLAVSGMNLPMLLEVVGSRKSMTDTELSNCAQETGKESICNINERFSLYRMRQEDKNDCVNQN